MYELRLSATMLLNEYDDDATGLYKVDMNGLLRSPDGVREKGADRCLGLIFA